MFGTGWQAVSEGERGELAGFVPAGANVERLVLPFYKTVSLMRVTMPVWRSVSLPSYFLVSQEGAIRLNGTSQPIHEVNGAVPIEITGENVVEYLKFHCFFVRGEEGPFLIVESDRDALGVGEYLLNAVGDRLCPVIKGGRDRRGRFICEAMVLYGGTLFECQLKVQPGGIVEMIEDEPVAQTGIRVDAPL